MDVNGAFLQPLLKKSDRIRTRLPLSKGLQSGYSQVVHLVSSHYALRQAIELWYECFSLYSYRIGLKRSEVTECLFTCDGPNPFDVIVYVEDLLVVCYRLVVDIAKTKLSELFSVASLRPCFYFLRIKIDQFESEMLHSQVSYAAQVVQRSTVT